MSSRLPRFYLRDVSVLGARHLTANLTLDIREMALDYLAQSKTVKLAVGTLIWGWGIFLCWWSFGVLALRMEFVVYRAFRYPVLQPSSDKDLPRGGR